LVCGGAAALGHCVAGLQRIVNDHEIGIPPPVRTPPTEVASRNPPAFVTSSAKDARFEDRRVAKSAAGQ